MAMYVSPKKHLGQHFLKDENIAKKIANSLSLTNTYKLVVEVGPGTGVLTKYLLQEKTYTTYVVEIDKESIIFLKKHFPDLEKKIIEKEKEIIKKRKKRIMKKQTDKGEIGKERRREENERIRVKKEDGGINIPGGLFDP